MFGAGTKGADSAAGGKKTAGLGLDNIEILCLGQVPVLFCQVLLQLATAHICCGSGEDIGELPVFQAG